MHKPPLYSLPLALFFSLTVYFSFFILFPFEGSLEVQGSRKTLFRKPYTLYPLPGTEGGVTMDGHKNLIYGLALLGVLLAWDAFSPTPALAQMAHQVLKGTSGDDTQITLGTPGRDFSLQEGLGR